MFSVPGPLLELDPELKQTIVFRLDCQSISTAQGTVEGRMEKEKTEHT